MGSFERDYHMMYTTDMHGGNMLDAYRLGPQERLGSGYQTLEFCLDYLFVIVVELLLKWITSVYEQTCRP